MGLKNLDVQQMQRNVEEQEIHGPGIRDKEGYVAGCLYIPTNNYVDLSTQWKGELLTVQ